MDNTDSKRILLSGGGTGGSVTPLLVIASALREEDVNTDLLFVGTEKGPEKNLVTSYKLKGQSIRFQEIPAGKLRRYFSWKNFTDIYNIARAFFVSLKLLGQEKPDIILSAGGFVSVPLAYAAYFKGVPVIIHQQDVRPGLANKLMAKVAKVITTTFETSVIHYGKHAVWTGNPMPKENSDEEVRQTLKKFGLNNEKPLLLITGGGTGSMAINEIVYESLNGLLPTFQIFHLTGKDKAPTGELKLKLDAYVGYKWKDMVSSQDMFSLMQASSLIVSRCGLGTLTEISALKKPAILIPMPNSHQEDNANLFKEKEAALVMEQKDLNSIKFVSLIKDVFQDKNKLNALKENVSLIMKKNATSEITSLINGLIEKQRIS